MKFIIGALLGIGLFSVGMVSAYLLVLLTNVVGIQVICIAIGVVIFGLVGGILYSIEE